jgi:transcriptional regulator with XRE-family HTH domain
MLSFKSDSEIALQLAARVKARRLRRVWTQAEMSQRAGIKVPTYIHFERTGQISLLRLLKILNILDLLPEFERIGQAEDLHGLTLDDVVRPERQRGRRHAA